MARPWDQGRAALEYRDIGRKLVLGLKHGDRHDVVRPAARWMARVARPILRDDMLIAPVPLHWLRLLKRKFNQSALLGNALARETGLECCPDLLLRQRATPSLDGKTRDDRFATLKAAITLHPRRRHRIAGRSVLIVDDVMTSGATLAAATDACRAAGARHVAVLVLARVAKDA
jgi:ComF family protein